MTDETKKRLEDKIIGTVKEYTGKKRFKPIDIVKEMEKEFSGDGLRQRFIQRPLV